MQNLNPVALNPNPWALGCRAGSTVDKGEQSSKLSQIVSKQTTSKHDAR